MRILKKVMAIVLALVIFVSGMLTENNVQASGTSVHSSEYIPIIVGQEQTVSITEEGQKVLFSFVPEESGDYIFKSSATNDFDTYATLYQVTPNGMEHIIEDDDSGIANNFGLFYSFVAGETYIFEVWERNSLIVEEFKVCLMEVPTEPIMVGQQRNVSVTEDGSRIRFSFEPEESGVYIFYASSESGDCDTCATLYHVVPTGMVALASDYDGGMGNNFELQYFYTAGETYMFEVRTEIYSSFEGEFDVFLVKVSTQPIVVGEEKTISIAEEGQRIYFSFVPEERGDYIFYSSSAGEYYDTYATLYRITPTGMEALVSDDDGSGYGNFMLSYSCFAYETYILEVRACNNISVGEFNVGLIEPPIESIEIEDVTLIEYSNGSYNGGDFIYSLGSLKATVKLKNGEEKDINGSFEIDDNWYGISTNAWELQQEGTWTAGNTYEVTGTLSVASDTFIVTIVESPIESIEIEDVSIIEGTNGYYSGEDFIYSIYPHELKATVKLKNGDEKAVNGYFEIDGSGYFFGINELDMQNEEAWKVGNTYTVTGTLLGVSDTFNVTIIESPIESIVLEDIVLYEGIDSSDHGDWEYYDVRPELSSVLLKNGEYADIENDWYIQYDGEYHGVLVDVWDMQYEEHWEAGKTYQVTGSILGVSATFNVTIQENPIREIELITRPEKTEYLTGEWCNLKGMSFRIKYEDGSSEDIVIEQEYTTCYWGEIWSKQLDRYDYISLPFDFTEVGQQDVELQLFGKTFGIPVTVKENLIESISIKENMDKSIIITVNNSDDSSYDMTLLDIYTADWGTDDAVAYVLFTDKGSFEALVFDNGDSFAIGLGDLHSENIIKSNSLSNSEWYETVLRFENFCASMLPGNKNFLNFNRQVTENNIDRIIGTAFYMGYTWDDETVVWEGDYATISGERIRESIAKYFALENVDLTLSESYDAQSDTYELFDYIRAGWMKSRPIEIKYRNGIWSAKVTYLGDDGTEMTTYLKLTDEQKILSYNVNATYRVGDVDGNADVTDTDALYLLYHTIFGDSYPIQQDCDYNCDGTVTDADALYLLYHTIFGDSYPLN